MSIKYWYMSFVDDKFLGALIIKAKTAREAVVISHQKKLNPGGEIMIVEIEEEFVDRIPSDWFGRLIAKDELVAIDKLYGFKD